MLELFRSRALLTARRPKPGYSLRKRRAWFAEGEDKSQDGQGEGEGGQQGSGDPMTSLEAFLALLPDNLKAAGQLFITNYRKTEKEAGDYRMRAKKAVEEKATAEQAMLAEQGKFKELYEQTLDELKAAKTGVERIETLEALITATNESRVKRIPEKMRPIVPTDYTPEQLSKWLDANEPLLTQEPAPSLDGGRQGDSGSSGNAAQLSQAELAVAKKIGITPEKFAKAKAAGGARSE